MKVIVGLGNPGPRYRKTRHNIGFEVVAEIAHRCDNASTRSRFDAEVSEVTLGEIRLVLLAPQTFMNNSGQSVAPLVAFYKLDPSDILVVCDDLNLPLGRLRLRERGSAGGQKGLADILRRLGTENVPRLRIGIGQPPGRMDASDFVLSRFRADEQDAITSTVVEAGDGAMLWAEHGPEAAMNRLNPATGEEPAKPTGE